MLHIGLSLFILLYKARSVSPTRLPLGPGAETKNSFFWADVVLNVVASVARCQITFNV